MVLLLSGGARSGPQYTMQLYSTQVVSTYARGMLVACLVTDYILSIRCQWQ